MGQTPWSCGQDWSKKALRCLARTAQGLVGLQPGVVDEKKVMMTMTMMMLNMMMKVTMISIMRLNCNDKGLVGLQPGVVALIHGSYRNSLALCHEANIHSIHSDQWTN